MSRSVTLRPDTKRRISPGKLARGISSFHASTDERGRIILEPYMEVPASEKWLFDNQPVLSAVKKGLSQAAAGRVKSRGSFARFASDTIDRSVTFDLRFTVQAGSDPDSLEADASRMNPLKAVRKGPALLETSPRHPGLRTCKFSSIKGPGSEEVSEACAENKTPAAWRIFWYYGPNTNRSPFLPSPLIPERIRDY